MEEHRNITTGITILDSHRFEHKYSTRTKTLYRLPKPRTEAAKQ